MLLLIIFIILAFLGVFFGCKIDSDGLRALGTFFIIIVVIFIVILMITYIPIDARIDRLQEQYNSLTYQAENHIYDNDNDVGKQVLMDQIREWNQDLAYGKRACHNIWYGMFYPKRIYDNFAFIPNNLIT